MKRKVFNIIWAFASAMLFSEFVCDNTLRYSNSIMSILAFVVLYFLLKKGGEFQDKRKFVYTHILGFLFSCMISMGYSLDVNETVFFSWQPICIILYTHNIAEFLGMLWSWLANANDSLNKDKHERKIHIIFQYPVIIWCVIIAFWIPAFLANYPGGFRYDATVELGQLANGYNGNIPLLHSLIVTRLIPYMHLLTGSWDAGVAVYVALQMMLAAMMYTHILTYFYSKGINRDLLLVLLVVCGGFPVIQMLVVQEVRDIMFSFLLVYTTFLVYMMVTDKTYFFDRIRRPLALGIFIVLTVYARNNNTGILMPVIVIIIIVIVAVKNMHKYKKGVIIMAVTVVVSYIGIGMTLTSLCQPYNETPSLSQSLSIMSQPLVRAYMNNSDWSEEDIDELGKYFDLDNMLYNPENADYTKNNLKITDNFGEFLRFWCKIGVRYPKDYIDGMLATSQNMWFPSSVVDGYNQSGIKVYRDLEKCYLYIDDDNEYPVGHHSYLPGLLKFYSNLGLHISFEKVPIISMMFSIGFWFWFVLNLVFYLVYRRNKKLLWPSVIILLYMFVSSFVPLVLLRYFAAVFLAIPLLVVFILQPDCE